MNTARSVHYAPIRAKHISLDRPSVPGVTTMHDVCRCTAEHFGVAIDALRGLGRQKTISHARHLAMFLCYELGYSSTEVGAQFDRDHSSVLAACNKVACRPNAKGKLQMDALAIKAHLAAIRERLSRVA